VSVQIRKPLHTGDLQVDKALQLIHEELIKINKEVQRVDASAIHKAVASEISALTEKATPVAGDFIMIEDSADSNNKKKIEIGNLP